MYTSTVPFTVEDPKFDVTNKVREFGSYTNRDPNWELGPVSVSARSEARYLSEVRFANEGMTPSVLNVRNAPTSKRRGMLLAFVSLKPGRPTTIRPPPTATLVPKRSAVR